MPNTQHAGWPAYRAERAEARRPATDQSFEPVDVTPREFDVLAACLDCFLDVGALGELIPRLGGQDVTAALDRLLQLAFVVGATLAVGVEAVLLRPTGAVLRVLETWSDLGDRQL